ncbi:MAG TPA: glycosyl hydrolase [Verrucomicrobiae bacterium]
MHTRRLLAFLPLLLALVLVQGAAPAADSSLARDFKNPPQSAKPWVYWFWLNGNISTQGITADLEAMKRVGIGGALIMEVDQGAPVGPVGFMSDNWRALFQHVHHEARRLGLEINLNNDAGWNGSGGPWIKPDQSMQQVVWSETNVAGPARFQGVLPQPKTVAGYYREITVCAFPTTGAYRIDRIKAKAAYEVESVGDISRETLGAEMVIDHGKMIALTGHMDGSGVISWDVPAGEWTLVRFGHTSTGVENAPAPASGRGLECDKLSATGIEASFDGMMAKLAADTGIQVKSSKAGLVATHIDSWENGSQNWTTRMREEFRQRRGYDLLPYLPVLTGRVVDSLEISERFLRDLRQTVSELVIQNYAGRMRELAHAHGMRFTVEAYGGPCDALPYAAQSDEPMGEFWTPNNGIETCRAMASAGHVYGKRIIGAEAFTSGDQEKWREHPALLKAHGDRAFCEGINRFVFHRYALQPWAEERRPGMTMGPWGQHYERTQTWWDWTLEWHQYLARCQFLLRQGLFVADICYVQPEMPPQGPGDHPRDGYGWDECAADAVLTRMTVKDGRIVLPDGMSYRLLVLPGSRTMTPPLLRKLRDLVEAGATVLGPKPLSSPSLSHYPECDAEIRQLGAELWGDCDGQTVKARPFGKGQIVWGPAPAQFLESSGVPADFASSQPLRFIHRRVGNREIYFVANPNNFPVTTTGSFRVQNKGLELWRPDTGEIEPAQMWRQTNGLTHVVLSLEPSGSVFVVFGERPAHADPVVSIRLNNKTIVEAAPAALEKVRVIKAIYGVPSSPEQTRDVTEGVQRRVDKGEFNFPVWTMAGDHDPAPGVVKRLSVDYEIEGKTFRVAARDPDAIHISRQALSLKVEKAQYGVLDDPKRTRDVRDRVQRLADAGECSFVVARLAEGDDPALRVVKTLVLEVTLEGKRLAFTGTDPEVITLVPPSAQAQPVANVRPDPKGRPALEARQPGVYECAMASGRTIQTTVNAAPQTPEVPGPWTVRFPPNLGAPDCISMPALMPLNEHENPGVKFFSGTATYERTVVVPRELVARGKRLYLDLGQVEVMARVTLNGRKLATLWKPPFRVDITDAAKVGDNKLAVQVVNLWPNRLIGDEQLPQDCDRNEDGTLKCWPQWLLEGKPSPTGRYTFTSWRLWRKEDRPLKSGLIGPITLQATVPVRLE